MSRLLVVGGWFLLHTPLFSARSVTVTGNVHETAAQVVAQAGLADHPPLLDVNAGAAAARLEQLPWVRSATVHVSWPDGVHIAVTEETPRFTAATAGGPVGVAQQRRPGARRVGDPPARAAAPDRARSRPARPGRCSPPRTPRASGSPRRCRLPSSAQVTAVTVEPAGWVQLALTTPVVVDIGTATQLTAKYEDVSSILAGATLHNGDVIDVSVPDAPTVTSG